MPPLSAAELREHLDSSSLSDSALERIIDDIYETIDDLYGPVGVDVVERHVSDYDSEAPIVLRRKPLGIVSIVEELDSVASVTRTLDATDWRLRGYILQRLRGGTYPARGWSVYGTVVTYTPRDTEARRAMAVVDIAKLEQAHSGFASRRIGDYSESSGVGQGGKSLEQTRREILRSRLGGRTVIA